MARPIRALLLLLVAALLAWLLWPGREQEQGHAPPVPPATDETVGREGMVEREQDVTVEDPMAGTTTTRPEE
ncbi:hypothetical protein [Thermaurantiacus sp.]